MITGVLILNKTFETDNDIKKFYKKNYLPIFLTTEIWIFIMYWFIITAFPRNIVIETHNIKGLLFGLIKNMLFLDWTSSGINQNIFGGMWYMPMILCIYPILPLISIILKRFSIKCLTLPCTLTFIFFMVLPLVNNQLAFMEIKGFSTYINNSQLPSYFILYILLGYLISKDCFKKFKDYQVLILTVIFFALCFAYQWYAYSKPKNYLVEYNFPLLLFVAAFLFEYIKRKAHWFEQLAKPFGYISKISFAIYFVHILIMDAIYFNVDLSGMRYPVKMVFLETVSVVGSIIIIALLSKIKLFKKYLFMIKD